MLVLTRKESERIIVGDGIEVVLVSLNGKSARIGIEAPADVKIIRQELLEANANGNEDRNSSARIGRGPDQNNAQGLPGQGGDCGGGESGPDGGTERGNHEEAGKAEERVGTCECCGTAFYRYAVYQFFHDDRTLVAYCASCDHPNLFELKRKRRAIA